MTVTRPSAHIEAMVCGYARNTRLTKSLVMLRAFFDESLSDEDGRDFVLAGYVQTASVWSVFSDDWEAVLNDSPPLKLFHMHEAFSALNGANKRPGTRFYGWSEEDVLAKISSLADVIQRHRPWSLESRMSTKSFYKVCDSIVPYDLRNPYLFCYFGIVGKLAEVHREMGITETVTFVFDENDEASREAAHFYPFFKKAQPIACQSLLAGTPEFLSDEDVKPLQAADSLAWHLRRAAEERNKNNPGPMWFKLFPVKHYVHRFTENDLAEMAHKMSRLEGIEEARPRQIGR